MKNQLFNLTLMLITAVSLFFTSCKKTSNKNDSKTLSEQEDVSSSNLMDLALSNMITYHDSALKAKKHSPAHLNHFDSIYHHHDSLYNHHHNKYHHGDTIHHHSGYHHTTVKHHKHDSISKIHHQSIH